MKGPKRYPPPESRAASKHVLVYPNWMSAQRYRNIIEPLLRETQAKNPALPYVKFIIEEL